MGDQPGGERLWRLTEEDAAEIAAPLARIANRYATLRGAAGFSDEISVTATVLPYVKRNLAERGRVKTALELAEREGPHASLYQPEPTSEPEIRVAEPTSQPESQPGSQPESQPDPGQADPAGSSEPEMDPKAGVADAFAYRMPLPEHQLPPHLEAPVDEAS